MNAGIRNTLRKISKLTVITKTEDQGRSEGQIRKAKHCKVQIFVALLLVTFSYLILNSPTYVYLLLVFAQVNRGTPYQMAFFYLVYSIGPVHKLWH